MLPLPSLTKQQVCAVRSGKTPPLPLSHISPRSTVKNVPSESVKVFKNR